MAVHPQAQAFLDQAAAGPALHEMPVADARAMFEAMAAMSGPPEAVASVDDLTVPGPGGPIPVRVYRPDTPTDAPLPVTMWFHAGGFTVGSLESHDPLCRAIANASAGIVVAVDYRRAPENKFPAPVDDAWAALQWVAAHAPELGGDPARLAVAGDSVGGCLATVMTLMARDQDGPALRFQALVYPDVDFRFTSPSWTTMGHDYFVTIEAARWLRDNYLSDESEALDWRVSPVLADDLHDLPPALLICPEFTPIRDDVEAYASRLTDAGVPTTYSLYAGMLMGFVSMAGIIDAGRAAIDEIGTALRKAFAD